MRNYIFFASDEQYYRFGYSDILDRDNVIFKTDFLNQPSKLLKKFNSFCCHSSIAKKFRFPFQALWYPHYCSVPFVQGDDYVFVFFHRWCNVFDNGYIQYLRKKYINCKCVLFLQDVNRARSLNIKKQKEQFDHVMVFEKNFANSNDIEYYPLVYGYHYENESNDRPIDLLFVGRSKGRSHFLEKVYKKLSQRGLNCHFCVTDVEKNFNAQASGLHVEKRIQYEENVNLLKKSKCVLDIVPSETNCNTIRMGEAIAFNNRMLTNNFYVKDEPFYSPSLISIYSSEDDIDIDFLKQPYLQINYSNRHVLSGKAFLEHLDQVLYPNNG